MPGNPWKLTTSLWQLIFAGLCTTLLLAFVVLMGCKRFDESLTRREEEEKSYTRHAMEYHREHPNERRGDSVLDTWSTTDYIARGVAKENLKGEWAKPSNQLSFLPAGLKFDSGGQPYCVIQKDEAIIVVVFLNKPTTDCIFDIAKNLDISKIQSGDMEFSGRTDYWTYVLKREVAQ